MSPATGRSVRTHGMRAMVAGLVVSLVAAAMTGITLAGTRLVFSVSDEPHGYQTVIDSFRSKFPGMEVELVSIPGGTYVSKLIAMMAGGAAPDVSVVALRMLGELREKGALEPLNPHIHRDKSFTVSAFFPLVMNAATINGQVYMIPRGNQSTAMLYNTDKMAEVGLPPPVREWRWEHEFIDTARKLNIDRNGDGTLDQFGFIGRGDWWWSLVWANGGAFLSDDDTRYVLGQPPGVRSIQFVADLQHVYHVTARAGELPSGDAFPNGYVAMVAGTHNYTRDLSIAGFTSYDVVELPSGTAGRSSQMDGAGYGIPVGCAHPREAWEFIKHLTSEEALIELIQERPLVPTRRSVALGPFLAKPAPPANRRAFVDALSYVRIPYVGGTKWSELQKALNGALAPVWSGQQSAAQALTSLEPTVRSILTTR